MTITLTPTSELPNTTPALEAGERATEPRSHLASRPVSAPLTAVRGLGVTFGGSAILNGFMAAGAAAAALGPLLRPGGSGAGRTLHRLIGLGATAAWVYTLAMRPWFLRWGAQDAELDRPMPGDEIVPHAIWTSTRAVAIDAPADEVWRWVVQFGQRRGGFYSYDWLENLAGLDIHSSNRILPEHQHPTIGQFIPGGPGEPEAGGGWTVVAIEPGHYLLVRVGAPSKAFKPAADVPFAATWLFLVEPVTEHTSRLIMRWRTTSRSRAFAVGAMVMTEVPHFVMERKMLLGIKQRAERAVKPPAGG